MENIFYYFRKLDFVIHVNHVLFELVGCNFDMRILVYLFFCKYIIRKSTYLLNLFCAFSFLHWGKFH